MQTLTGQEVLPVGELIISNAEVTPQTIVDKVAGLFFSTTDLDAITLTEQREESLLRESTPACGVHGHICNGDILNATKKVDQYLSFPFT